MANLYSQMRKIYIIFVFEILEILDQAYMVEGTNFLWTLNARYFPFLQRPPKKNQDGFQAGQLAWAQIWYILQARMGPKGGPHEAEFWSFSKIKMDVGND